MMQACSTFNGGETRPDACRPFTDRRLYPPAAGQLAGGLQCMRLSHENVYTNCGRALITAFGNVVETFRVTDSPRRMRVGICITTFIPGTQSQRRFKVRAIFTAICLSKQPLSLGMSDYLCAALTACTPTFAGPYSKWRVADSARCRAAYTVRLDPSQGWPDLMGIRRYARCSGLALRVASSI